MLSTIPTRGKTKPRNWTVTALITTIIILVLALSGLTGLYLSGNHITQPNIIIVNQTSNNTTTNHNQPVQNTSNKTTSHTNDKKPNYNTPKDTNQKTSSTEFGNHSGG